MISRPSLDNLKPQQLPTVLELHSGCVKVHTKEFYWSVRKTIEAMSKNREVEKNILDRWVKDKTGQAVCTPAHIRSKAAEILKYVYDYLPEGKVITYGDISKKVYGKTGRELAVVSSIKAETNRNDEFPWWRVVNKKLEPTKKPKGARERLENEGVSFLKDNSVDPKHRVDKQ